MTTNNVFDANRVARAQSEAAREAAKLETNKALALARKCKVEEGETVDPQVKAQASEAGKQAYAARKAAKEAEAAAASARRVACFKAMPARTVPEIPKGPLSPPSRRAWEE